MSILKEMERLMYMSLTNFKYFGILFKDVKIALIYKY